MERLSGIDLDSARRVAGNGFLLPHGRHRAASSSILTYARDFMIERGFHLLRAALHDPFGRCDGAS